MKRSAAIAVTFALLALSPIAAAQGAGDAATGAARQLADEGGQRYLAGDYPGAIDKLSKAYEVVKVPTLAYYLGDALEKVGRWVEAAERYREVELLPLPDKKRAAHEKAKADAKLQLQALEPRIPKLELIIEGDSTGIVITLDGHTIPSAVLATTIPIDPGDHVAAATRGGQRQEKPFTAREREQARVVLSLPPSEVAPPPVVAPAPEPQLEPLKATPRPSQPDQPAATGSWMTPVGWIGIGVGGAGALVGGIAGAVMLSSDGELEQQCVDNSCVPSAADSVETFNAMRPITTIGLVIAGVGLAGGVTLLLLAPADTTPETALVLGPASASMRVRF
jgi:hypothetical protein